MDKVTVSLNGVETHPFESFDDVVAYAASCKKILVAVNAHKIINATEETRRIINNNIGYADGLGAVLALKQKGAKQAVKIPGCELWLKIIEKYSKSKTFYFVGGEKAVISDVINRVKYDFPEINIVNFRDGYIKTEAEENRLIKDIEVTRPDVVFVAMGSPKQELLMQKMYAVHTAIYQGLGGSFDVYTNKVNRAPKLWVTLHLEWAYRWLKEPKLRTKRNLDLFKFFWCYLFKKL